MKDEVGLPCLRYISLYSQRLDSRKRHSDIPLSSGLRSCPFCRQGALRIIAAITQAEVIRKMLRHLKLAADPLLIAPARVRQAAFQFARDQKILPRQVSPEEMFASNTLDLD